MVFFGKQGLQINCRGKTIESSNVATLLGMKISSEGSWKAHVRDLLGDLDRRVGVLRRLRCQIPLKTLLFLIDSLLISKIRFGLEAYADPTVGWKEGEFKCSLIAALQVRLNNAIRACFGLSLKDRIPVNDLLKMGQQQSVLQLAIVANAVLAWQCHHRNEPQLQNSASTRSTTRRDVPEISTRGSYLRKAARIWNVLPEKVRSAETLSKAKHIIKDAVTHLEKLFAKRFNNCTF